MKAYKGFESKVMGDFEQLVAERPSFKRRFLLTAQSAQREDELALRARQDVQQIAAECGYAVITFPPEKPVDKWWQQLAQYGQNVLEWGRLFFKLDQLARFGIKEVIC